MMPRISILMYHQVGEFPPMERHRANYCDHRRFAAQMALLCRGGFHVLTLDDALSCLRGERETPARAVVLTFDDGYENFIEHALPALAGHGFPATVYAISNWVGRRAEWFAKDAGRPVPHLMNVEQLRTCRAAGVTIGSHTANHVRLGEVEPRVQRAELTASKWALEDLLGEEVRHLCYPYGSFDQFTVQAATEAGYASAATCLRAAATAADHPLVLPRKAISFGDNLAGYAWKLLVKHAPKPVLTQWRRRLAAPDL